MRLTLATILLAVTVVAADAHDSAARGHDAIAKRHRGRALNTTEVVERMPHRVRFPGTHDIDDVPEGLEWDEEHADAWSGFADGPEDDWDNTPEEYVFDPKDNSTSKAVTAREYELEARATKYPKQGIAWTNEVANGLAQFKNNKAFGLYSWTEWWPDQCKKYNIRFFPMLKTYEKRDKFKNAVKKGYGNDYLMGPNEVNLKSQANMSPGRAAWMFRTYLMPLKSKYGYKLVGPSTANGNSAITWYDEFKRIAPDVWKKIDAINVHYYGLDANLVTAWMEKFHSRYGKNIWLTEYACHSFTGKGKCSASQALAFMKTIAKFCESKSWCETHMIYGQFVNSRTGVSKSNAVYSGSSGALTALGKAYLTI